MAEPRGGRAAHCVHTVPDWARYVRAPDEGPPILAACRLLVKEREPADDARTIACGYWGRQAECPLYEGPGGSAASAGSATPPDARRPEEPLTANQLRRARLAADAYAPRGPLTEVMRQHRRASTAGLALLALLAALAAMLTR